MFNSPGSGGYEKRSSQSTTSSPASNTAQLRCDFCAEPFYDVDSHCAHLIFYHGASSPFHCGRTSCSKTFKDERSLKRHLTELHLGAAYVCRCDRQCGRKDKHCKHLEINSCTGHGLYRCPCGHAVHQLNTHKHYIEKCGRKRRGRQCRQHDSTGSRAHPIREGRLSACSLCFTSLSFELSMQVVQMFANTCELCSMIVVRVPFISFFPVRVNQL
ncbi:uncharacterized protein BKA55DRAFT_270602 [Fusarium redolens]|uniref:C2H2-type domain-containing protein n=1 Tax=Fusarium redolens TaxID=48865 RepID=A0A9P9KFJ3_FUSRE|nr:uncharacterized protein BKA55DRAFT_270602 [Fusarium redolens]KAH7260832.1 hypothetical protein BKA55DRAFT_270602 [Fusarium redolens]